MINSEIWFLINFCGQLFFRRDAVSSLFLSVKLSQTQCRRGFAKAWHGDRDAANTSIFTIHTRWMEKASLLPKMVTARAWVQLVLYKQQHELLSVFLFFFFVLIYSFLFLERIIQPLETCTDRLGLILTWKWTCRRAIVQMMLKKLVFCSTFFGATSNVWVLSTALDTKKVFCYHVYPCLLSHWTRQCPDPAVYPITSPALGLAEAKWVHILCVYMFMHAYHFATI